MKYPRSRKYQEHLFQIYFKRGKNIHQCRVNGKIVSEITYLECINKLREKYAIFAGYWEDCIGNNVIRGNRLMLVPPKEKL